MFSLLVRYNWTQFSIVTSDVPGHAHFVDSVQQIVDNYNRRLALKPSAETKREK